MATSPRIVVVGSGFAGLETLFNLRMRLGRSAPLALVAENDQFLFKPNTIYIPFGKDPDRYVIPIGAALERRHIEFVKGRAHGVDVANARLQTDAGDVAYDHLVIASGASMRPEEVPGLAEHACTIWEPSEMLRLRAGLEKLVEDAGSGARQQVLFAVPPMNKCSGPLYEMVMMLDTWLGWQGVRSQVDVRYTTFEHSYIQAFGPRLHDTVQGEFERRGVTGEIEKSLVRVEAGRAYYADGEEVPFDLLISFPPYVASTSYEGLPADDRGFLTAQLGSRQVEQHPDIYAVGDAGNFPVKQAFLALLQADAAAEHLVQRVQGEEPHAAFDPVSMCIMEQFDKATFAQVPLELTGDADRPVRVREADWGLYKVGSGSVWRLGKKMLGSVLPARFKAGQPFHAGTTWEMMEGGLKVMAAAFAD
jgi:NADH dehydrogenase FAD-containing subunit